MSRSGYGDCHDQWTLICWRGAVASAIRGRRGQALLRDMLAALDALPAPRLIEGYLEREGPYGGVCALGAVGRARGMDMHEIEPADREQVAACFGIAEALAAEIAYVNDEDRFGAETPEQRWVRVRKWVERQLAPEAGA